MARPRSKPLETTPRVENEIESSPVNNNPVKLARVPGTSYYVDLSTGQMYLSPELLKELIKFNK